MGNRIVEFKEDIYAYIQKTGPVLPARVASHFHATNLFVSAILSELVATKKLLISRAKIGGSPVYYCKHHESMLFGMLKSHLGQVQREALSTLQEKRVLRDRDCLPHERVALRELHDFAKPIKFVVHDTEEWFWIWYLLPEEEAKKGIGEILERVYASQITEEQEPKKEQQESIIQKVTGEQESVEEEKQEEEPKEERVKEKQVSIVQAAPVVEQKSVVKKKKKRGRPEKKIARTFEESVFAYFKEKGIKVVESSIIGKNKEMNMMIQVSSALGNLSYYVKAKNKKRVTEGDLLLAFTEGQNAKLPTVFLCVGGVTKKAKQYMEKNLRSMNVMTLEKQEE